MRAPFPTLLLLPTLVATLAARTWTDVGGRMVEADYVSHDNEEVAMRLPDGSVAQVPLARLSAADLKFLEATGKSGADAKTTPAEEPGALNWNDPWPDSIVLTRDPQIEVVEENTDGQRFIYASENYRFTCDARLSKSVIGTFADMFEATRLLCRALPLGITGGTKRDGKYDILLFDEKENYIKAGGPPSSAGVFIGGRNVVMVPLTSLGVRKVGSGYMRDRDKSDGTLIHELVHQLTPGVYYLPGALGWFSEGLAEYCTATRYRSGRFTVRNNLDEIEAYATAFGKDDFRGRALGEEFNAPSLETFMLMDYASFAGSNGNFNYGLGLLLTTYFFHFDGEGDAARIKAFLKALREPGNRRDPKEALDKLLDGRTWKELEEEVHAAWRKKGVKINFPE